jgi:hypothetical protein
MLTLLASSCSKADREIGKNDCIEVVHVGSQDVPVGGFRMCVGEAGRGREDSLEKNRWTFFFDVATYRRLNDVVLKNSEQGPIEVGRDPQSSFAVTWDTREGKRKYLVAPRNACTYVKALIQTVTADAYAQFRKVGDDMLAREGCQRISPP